MSTWIRRRSDSRAPRLVALLAGTLCAVGLAVWFGRDGGTAGTAVPAPAGVEAATLPAADLAAQLDATATARATVADAADSPVAPGASSGGLRGQVVDPHDRPAPGSRVRLIRWEAELIRRGDGQTVRETVSDALGAFDLGEPPDFACVLRAEHDDWWRADLGPRTFRSGESVELTLLSGWKLEGEVVGPNGDPVEAASVVVSQPPPAAGPILRWTLAETSTDSRGRFQTHTLPRSAVDVAINAEPGSVVTRGLEPLDAPMRFRLEPGVVLRGVVIDAASAVPIAGARVAHATGFATPATTDASGRFEIRLPGGHTAGLCAVSTGHLPARIEAGDELWIQIALLPRPRVRGSVRCSNGISAAGARLEIRPEPDASSPDRTAVADSNGEFDWLLPAVGDGITLVALLDGVGSASAPPRAYEAGELHDGIVLRIDDSAGLWGWVRDPAGTPISAAVVEVFDPRAIDLSVGAPQPRHSATSAGDGSYRLALGDAGEWKLRARASGFATCISTEVIEAGGVRVQRDIVLQPGGTIAGRVVDAGGNGVPAAEVGLADETRINVATTDASGAFRFDGASDAAQIIVAHKTGYTQALVRDVRPSPVPMEIVLVEGAVIRGMVAVADDGRPVQEFRVLRWREDADSASLDQAMASVALPFSSQSGSFEIDGLAAGRYLLRVEADGFVPWEDAGINARPASEESGVLVQMSRGAELVGLVLDVDGGTIAGAEVLLQREADPMRAYEAREAAQTKLAMRTLATLVSDANGRFRYSSLREGDILVRVKAAGHAPVLQNVKIADSAGAATQIEIRLKRSTSVSGRVWTQDGQPVAGATVFTQGSAANGWSFTSTQCDLDGNFQLDGIAPGSEYTIVANISTPQSGGFLTAKETLKVDGPIEGLTLVLR